MQTSAVQEPYTLMGPPEPRHPLPHVAAEPLKCS